ncbi:MAG: nucleotidyl transferase AbiEii/AbiGii toxin family protein, partial [Acidimicrobiales bacterium]
RDLIDIVLLWDLATADRPSVRQACEQIFELRALHPWPPRVQPPAEWTRPYGQLATEIRFPLDELDAAVVAVNAIIDDIAEA